MNCTAPESRRKGSFHHPVYALCRLFHQDSPYGSIDAGMLFWLQYRSAFCVLCSAFRVPCSVFCVSCSAFCVPRSAFRVPCSVFRVLRSVFCVLCSAFCVPCSVFRVLCSVFERFEKFESYYIPQSVSGFAIFRS